VREISFTRGKLNCDCGDSVFMGVPCRHLLALVSKEDKLSYSFLPINIRWKIAYYTDKESIRDPMLIQNDEESKENNFGASQPKITVKAIKKLSNPFSWKILK